MAATIGMVSGEEFVVEVDVEQVASEVLTGADKFARFEGRRKGSTARRVWVNREHVSYVEEYERPQPRAAFG
jgi:hypothetical protein